MSANSKIEWCHHTFNPWWGCTKVSPACDHCYAESLAKRYGHGVWGKDAPRRFFGDKHWAEPLQWNREAESARERRRVFCGSMCDVMEDREDLRAPRVRLFNLIAETPHLDWLLLTKRPQNFRKFLPWGDTPGLERPNVWLMTTVESQEYVWRAERLVDIPAVVHGISYEPALGPLDISRDLQDGINWVIAGGESGGGARPPHPDWFRQARDQCVAANVPFFFKQNGEWLDIDNARDVIGEDDPRLCDSQRHRRRPALTAVHNLVQVRVGKKAAGALLDGKEWKQFPGERRESGHG